MLTPTKQLELIHAVKINAFYRVSQLLPRLYSQENRTSLTCLNVMSRECFSPLGLNPLSPLTTSMHYLAHIAAEKGYVELLKLIIYYDNSALNRKDLNELTPLVYACASNHLDVVIALLQFKELELDKLTRQGYTALHHAVSRNHSDIVKVLLQAGANSTLITQSGLDLIHIAAKSGNQALINYLLTRDPSLLWLTDINGSTPLTIAIRYGQRNVVNNLLDKYLSNQIICDYNGLLNLALDSKDPNLFIDLITKLQPNKPINCILTSAVAVKGYINIAAFVLGHNYQFDPTLRLAHKMLILAAGTDKLALVAYLLSNHNLNLNVIPDYQHTDHSIAKSILISAIEHGSNQVLNYLTPICVPSLKPYETTLIHRAALFGRLSLVTYLIETNPRLLNHRDRYANTALRLAASKNRTEIVSYLLANEGIDLELHTLDKNHVLNYAIKEKLWGVANLLIKKLLDLGYLGALNYINNYEQTEQFIVLFPECHELVVQNPRISQLLKKDDARGGFAPISIYLTRRERGLSFFATADLNQRTVKLFKPNKALGKGNYGEVRLFTSETGEHIAVKSAGFEAAWLSENELTNRKENNDHETAMLKKYHPDKACYNWHFASQNFLSSHYSDCLVMPYHTGETFCDFMDKTNDLCALANVILLIINELDSLHKKGIIHGDIHLNNIIVSEDNQSVYFIDFGMSQANSMRITKQLPYCPHFPPERNNNQDLSLIAESNQDIFSLGYSLMYNYITHPAGYELIEQYPSLIDFSTQALDENPMNRPKLSDFYASLSAEINGYICYTHST